MVCLLLIAFNNTLELDEHLSFLGSAVDLALVLMNKLGFRLRSLTALIFCECSPSQGKGSALVTQAMNDLGPWCCPGSLVPSHVPR